MKTDETNYSNFILNFKQKEKKHNLNYNVNDST